MHPRDGGSCFDNRPSSEQAWDEADKPKIYMFLGQPTGSAMPLMWAHAEYIKLLRSTADGKVYDTIPEVAERYLAKSGTRKQTRSLEAESSGTLHALPARFFACKVDAPFTLHWSSDNWKSATRYQFD